MSKELKIILAGFGGQGILFSGKLIAYSALYDGKEVTWLPSYGPEMRGGTANCAVRISQESIGSPLITNPKILMAMNQPSYDKFVGQVEAGGALFYDSTLIKPDRERPEVDYYPIAATGLANEQELKGLANIILMGKMFRHAPWSTWEGLLKGLEKCIPPQKQHLLQPNRRALELGMEG